MKRKILFIFAIALLFAGCDALNVLQNDTTPPVVSINSHTNGQVVEMSYILSGTVMDDSGNSGIILYVKTGEGSYQTAELVIGDWIKSIQLTNTGIVTNYAIAMDLAGNVSATNSVWVEVIESVSTNSNTGIITTNSLISTNTLGTTITIENYFIDSSNYIVSNLNDVLEIETILNILTNSILWQSLTNVINETNIVSATTNFLNIMSITTNSLISTNSLGTIVTIENFSINISNYIVSNINDVSEIENVMNILTNLILWQSSTNIINETNFVSASTNLVSISSPSSNVTAISPANSATNYNGRPMFIWSAYAGADGYLLDIDSAVVSLNGSTTNYQPSSNLALGTPSWYIIATNNGGLLASSETNNFSIGYGRLDVSRLDEFYLQ